jgi:hypothetical protein
MLPLSTRLFSHWPKPFKRIVKVQKVLSSYGTSFKGQHLALPHATGTQCYGSPDRHNYFGQCCGAEEPKLNCLLEPEPKLRIAAPAPFYLPQT